MQHRVLRELLRPGAPNLISRQGNVSKRKQGSVLEEHGGALCKEGMRHKSMTGGSDDAAPPALTIPLYLII